MECLPDELLQKLLNHAMIRDAPLYLEEFVRASKSAANRKESSCKLQTSPGPPKIYDELHSTQQPHLLDWRLIVGTCKRFRRLGKEAFFANKTFVMNPETVDVLQQLQFMQLSKDDQQTALMYMTSITFAYLNNPSPRPFLVLPRRVSAFPHIVKLGHLFGYRRGEPVDYVIRAAQQEVQAPAHFVDALTSSGVATHSIQLTVMICPDTNWTQHEADLKGVIYPLLEWYLKTKKAAKGGASNSQEPR